MASSFVKNGRTIIAIGRNYAEHIKELNNATPKQPFFFLKPTSSYLISGGNVEIPEGVVAHHEVELAAVIGKKGRDIPQSDAEDYIAGYALAVDMTARNMQDLAKKEGKPWTTAKGFDTFTPISDFIHKSEIADPHNLRLTLKIDGVPKQNGSTSDMIYKIPQLIQHVSSIMTLQEGDVILTGTPSGVGPVSPGEQVECSLKDGENVLAELRFGAVQRSGGYHFQGE